MVVLALLVGGCSRTRTPTQVVRDAVVRTLGGDVTFALTAAADRTALDALGPDAAPVASALNGFSLLGARTAGATRLVLQVRGDVRLVELVTFGDGSVYLRTDLTGLEGDGLDRLLDDLSRSGAPASVVTGVETLFGGDWVGVTGEAALDGLLDGLDGEDVAGASEPAAVGPALEDVLRGLVGAAQVGEPTDLPADARRYPLTIAAEDAVDGLTAAGDTLVDVPVVGALLAGLEGGDVAGDLVVADGVVTSILVRVRAGAVDAGNLELRLDLADHGDVAPIPVPDAVAVTAEDLAAALRALLATSP